MIKFFSSYVGSKAYWVKELDTYKGRDFVELFCGSGVLSANLASKAVLNDLDPFIYKILYNFEQQEVPDSFTKEDYFDVRGSQDWWKHSYCLQKMSFSGVFRYSKNGFNVPIKPNIESVSLTSEYREALERYIQLSPVILNRQYHKCQEFITANCVLVLDPPYENAQASYNKEFDYQFFWEYVRLNENICKTIMLYDYESNLPFGAQKVRKTRVNGARKGNVEGIFIFEDSLKEGQKGEELFFDLNLDKLNRADGLKFDFTLKATGKTVELKSDYYDMTRTDNFFIERYSDFDKKTNGGPWQSFHNSVDYYVYFYVKNKKAFIFKTKDLVDKLNSICSELNLIFIPNKSWTTAGYKINRNLLEEVLLQEKQYV